jgi:hypothetical protein
MENTPIMLHILINVLFYTKIIWIILLVVITERLFEGQDTILDNYDIGKIYTDIDDIWNILIGVLLVYLYNHLTQKTVCISGHTKLYLYLFGIMTVVEHFYVIYKRKDHVVNFL